MKKGILLLVAILSLSNLTANTTNTTTKETKVNYNYNDAVTFIENGIEFNIFLNGQFDFNQINNNRNSFVRRDNFGRIRQVGNTVINYAFNGKVAAIGNIPVRYSFGQLRSVGNLTVQYDNWGYPHYSGFVQQNRFYNDGFNLNINLGTICNYDDAYFYNSGFRNNYRQFREDDNFFYYRAIPNARIGQRNKILKRRKPNRNIVKANNRYLNNNRKLNTVRKNTKGVNTQRNNSSNITKRKTTPIKTTRNNKVTNTSRTSKSVTSNRRTTSNRNSNTRATTNKLVNKTRKTNTAV